MGRVLALDVSHSGHPLNDVANFGKLALIGCSACVRGWPLTLLRGHSERDLEWLREVETSLEWWLSIPQEVVESPNPCDCSDSCDSEPSICSRAVAGVAAVARPPGLGQ